MKITVDEARKFFADKSQQVFGITPETLPDEGFEYWASGPACCVFHISPWPKVFMVHIAVKPEGLGCIDRHVMDMIEDFWMEKSPERIVAWVHSTRRLVLSLGKRCGFVEDGRFPVSDGEIAMIGWSWKCH